METSYNRTKIIATVGPASSSKEKLVELVKAGVDVFRLNFSHGSHKDHMVVIKNINEINREYGTHISILQDLQGPKIRIGEVENGEVIINPGDKLTISTEKIIGNAKKVFTTYTQIYKDVQPGEGILVDDGKIELKVLEVDKKKKEILTEVIYGGPLRSKKGINLPSTKISLPSLTEKDLEDLEFGLKNNIDWIALSFVRHADDVKDLRKRIKAKDSNAKIISKVEKPEAIENIDEIIEASDAIMVARGDLGVEIYMEEVPIVQKMIAKKCKYAAKPVIIATQMMESMIENPRPTRAETNDVANAVLDGADVLMLSGETSVGKYPIQTVISMSRTIQSVEENADIYYKHYALNEESETFVHDSVISMSVRLAEITDAKAITGMTFSGYTGFRLSGHRPKSHIFIFTANKSILSTLNLLWGVRGIYYDKFESTDDTIEDLEKILVEQGYLSKGDVYINTASMPMYKKLRTNMVKLSVVE